MQKQENYDEFWQGIINSLPDPVFVKDEQHRWIAFNDAFCSFMGYPRAALLGKSDYDFFPKEEADEFWAVDEMVFRTGQENENEEYLTDSSGRTHTIATKKAVLLTPSDQKVLVGVIRNISAHKRAKEALEELNRTLEQQVTERTAAAEERALHLTRSERALREQTSVLESILQSLNDGVMVMDPAGQLLLENHAIKDLIGKPSLDGPFLEWLSEHTTGAAKTRIPELVSESPSCLEEVPFFDDATNNVRWLDLNSQPLLDSDGTRRGTVLVLRDVTARRSAEKNLRESELRLYESHKMEALGRLAGGVAHDFNNLLTLIQGSVSIIDRETPSKTTIREELEQISGAVERAASLTRQLLAFGSRQVVQPRKLDLGGVVEGMAGMLRRVIGERVQMELFVEDDLPAVTADQSQMEQVLLNLVLNARDAMPDGGRVDISVRRSEDLQGPSVVLSVADLGQGMDEETRLRVFEPFFTTKALTGGIGLGLPTVYGIVRQANGSVTVESKTGEGAIFVVKLPAAEGVEPFEDSPRVPSQDLPLTGSECILLVEDEDSIRDLVGRVLREHGYTVLSCSNGEEAIGASKVHRGKIDLVLTDIIMPGPSGPQVATIVKEERPEAQVLFMSGYSDEELVKYGSTGADFQFIQKPFALTELLLRIRTSLNE